MLKNVWRYPALSQSCFGFQSGNLNCPACPRDLLRPLPFYTPAQLELSSLYVSSLNAQPPALTGSFIALVFLARSINTFISLIIHCPTSTSLVLHVHVCHSVFFCGSLKIIIPFPNLAPSSSQEDIRTS